MKKVFVLLIAVVSVFVLGACSNTGQERPVEVLSDEEVLAQLSYLSAGILDTTENNISVSRTRLSLTDYLEVDDVPETEFETELDEVNVYLEKLKGFIENGSAGFGNVETTESDREEYEQLLTVVVEDEVYLLYYNVDEFDMISGVFVIGDVEYMIETVENESDVDDEEDDSEEPIDESEQKMTLVATNGLDTITITYKVEEEEGESTTKFEMVKDIAGVVTEVSIKISVEENEFKVDIFDGENEYTFKMDSEDGETMYKLQYLVNGVRGQVKIKIMVDEFGEEYYAYQIIEQGKTRSVDRGRPESYGWGDDEEETEETEETEGQTT